MDLELTTLNDIVNELRRRRMRFVLVAVEPSNNEREATIMHAAQGIHAQDMLGLVKLAWHQVMKEGGDEGGLPPSLN
jgi:hypothetical protein